MALCTDNLQAACRPRVIIQLDICSTSRHVGSDCHSAMDTGVRYNLRLKFMVLGIQDIVLDAFLLQHPAQELGHLDCNRADQHRLSDSVSLLDRLNDSLVFFFLCLIYGVLPVHSLYRDIGRDLDDVHSVNITELFFFRQRSTRHTALFVKLVEQVLECDRRESLALSLHLHMLLRLDRLMEAV